MYINERLEDAIYERKGMIYIQKKGLFKKKIRRFEVLGIQTKGITGGCLKIIVDRNTGVHYIIGDGLVLAGITPLLDERGRPIIIREKDRKT